MGHARSSGLVKLSGSLTCESPRAVVMQGAESDRWPLYAAAIEVAAEGRQALVVAPDAPTAAELAEWLAARVGKTVAATTARDRPPSACRCGARCGRARSTILVGTRDATFAPLTRLGLVIVEREEDAGHKQRVAPRYHVPVCAAKLAELCGCLLVLGTETPRVATFHAVETEQGAPRYGRVARAVALGAATRGRRLGGYRFRGCRGHAPGDVGGTLRGGVARFVRGAARDPGVPAGGP